MMNHSFVDERKMLTYGQVVDVILTERTYQDKDLIDKKWDHKGFPSVEAELLLAEEYLLIARSMWVSAPGSEPCLDSLRKVAAVLMRCFENHGCPPRKIG